MANLSKGKFRKKRQLINKITENHTFKIAPIDTDNINHCKSFLNYVNKQIITDGIEKETHAMTLLLDHYFELGCDGFVLYIDEAISAMIIGEKLDHLTYVIHLEKGCRNYTGACQLIFQEYSKLIKNNFAFINREQDMGIPGLRQAKSSYFPIRKLHKYDLQFIE